MNQDADLKEPHALSGSNCVHNWVTGQTSYTMYGLFLANELETVA